MIESHSILGLACAALIYVVSLTGAFAMFLPEIELWESPAALAGDDMPAAAMANAAAAAAERTQPGNEILNVVVYPPHEARPFATVRLNQRANDRSPLDSRDWFVDAATGEMGARHEPHLAGVIEHLHTDLHLPRPVGRYLVGLLGVVMFTLILSGILAHPTIVRDAFKLRLDRNARLAWTDVHNRLSVWGLPFHLVLTF
ncbi:MAG: PepSY-associated TM helix domain-containing protein, partial [Pseudomonadota bacterium]